ncbi:M20 family metallopeptidase [Natronobiforma cellulositropha]|uniref:M20 family metallopeptidase n=1 Tax=Natronobiforma cellulositropha TaxID=1679076 RepID=UPI0021D5BF71|nr:M20/M25/M40 family metallo-hydrolase [Natronobiforma cellulositropha]
MTGLSDLTEALVTIPSHDGEREAGDYIERWLTRETSADVTRDDAGNVIARAGEGAKPALALVGHHDVVPPAEAHLETDGSYAFERRGGRLYGRGTADMKGALAAAMLAFRDGADDATGEAVFASFVGEEVGGVGAQYAVEQGFAPEYAIVGEGSTNYSGPDVTDVAVAHRGRRDHRLTAHGVASHASEPEAGENAIYRASDAIEFLRTLETPTLEVADDTLSGSVVVTEIDGGTAMNVVPERCALTVDERTVPGEDARVERVAELDGLEWELAGEVPPMRCRDEAFATAVLETADAAQPATPALVTKPHATDAGWLARAGTECVICGPAEPGEAHTATESVSVAVLERCYETYRRALESWPSV